MNYPTVSVLMTSYNRERYIADAIESVLASTFRDFELIIVDDRSSDKTVEIATAYSNIDSRVKIYINETNLGDYPNRNRAATLATGKYLKYVDADDFIYPWGLEILVNMMERFPSAGWGLCSIEQDKSIPFPFMLSPEMAYDYHYFGPGLFHKAPLSSIIVREVFIKEGGFSGKRMIGDYEMWHKLGQKYNVVLMPQGIVWYRKHDDQEMKDYNQFVTHYDNVKMEFLTSDDCPLSKDKRIIILKRIERSLKFNILKSVFKMKPSKINHSIKQLKKFKSAPFYA